MQRARAPQRGALQDSRGSQLAAGPAPGPRFSCPRAQAWTSVRLPSGRAGTAARTQGKPPGREHLALSPLLGLILFPSTPFRKTGPVRGGLPHACVRCLNKAGSPSLPSWRLGPRVRGAPTPLSRGLPLLSPPVSAGPGTVSSWTQDVLKRDAPTCKDLPHTQPTTCLYGHHQPRERGPLTEPPGLKTCV